MPDIASVRSIFIVRSIIFLRSRRIFLLMIFSHSNLTGLTYQIRFIYKMIHLPDNYHVSDTVSRVFNTDSDDVDFLSSMYLNLM